MAEDIVERFSCVVEVPAGSRLLRYRDVVSRYIQGELPFSEPEKQTFGRALTEIAELHSIALQFATKRSSSGIRTLLKNVISGQTIPDGESSSRARSDQFHLYIASVLVASGAKVEFAEPDLRLIVGTERLSIAAKRVVSPKMVIKRIREALKQIRKQQIPGVAYVDISQAISPTGIYMFSTPQEIDYHTEKTSELAENLCKQVLAEVSKSVDAIAFFLQWTLQRTIAGSGSIESAQFITSEDWRDLNPAEQNLLDTLRDCVCEGLKITGQHLY